MSNRVLVSLALFSVVTLSSATPALADGEMQRHFRFAGLRNTSLLRRLGQRLGGGLLFLLRSERRVARRRFRRSSRREGGVVDLEDLLTTSALDLLRRLPLEALLVVLVLRVTTRALDDHALSYLC